jgi:Methyltransferase domain
MSVWHAFILPITGYFRKRRMQMMREACPELFDDAPRRVLDLGGSQHFWANFPIDLSRKQVVIYNISHDETASRQDAAARIPVKIYDGAHLPEADGSFDVVVCNSVLEHVPVALRPGVVAEMRRVGKRLLVQTPAFEFPVEPHFIFPLLHWLPRWLGRPLVLVSPWFWLSRPGVAHAGAYFDEIQLPTRADIDRLFPGSTVRCERVAGLVKSYVVSATGLKG